MRLRERGGRVYFSRGGDSDGLFGVLRCAACRLWCAAGQSLGITASRRAVGIAIEC